MHKFSQMEISYFHATSFSGIIIFIRGGDASALPDRVTTVDRGVSTR